MRIRLLFFSQLRERFGAESHADLAEGTRVEEVARQYDLEGSPVLFAVNEDFVPAGTTLKDQDTLALLMPMSGGCG